MVDEIALVTLKKPVTLPGLSRRTGKPCRAVTTRQLVVRREGYQLAVEGCLDPRGAPHRTALRIIMVRVVNRARKQARVPDGTLLEGEVICG